MKVLTLREPWATLIGMKVKTIETRSWKTNYRGDLLIHAGLVVDKYDELPVDLKVRLENEKLQCGNIFIKCRLVDCVPMTESFIVSEQKRDPLNYVCGTYAEGRFAWILEDVEVIKPIAATGHLGLWNYGYE